MVSFYYSGGFAKEDMRIAYKGELLIVIDVISAKPGKVISSFIFLLALQRPFIEQINATFLSQNI